MDGVTINTIADDNGYDHFDYYNFEGDNNLIVINILNDVVFKHNEYGWDKSYAFIRCKTGKNNHFIVNIVGSLNLTVSMGAGGSGFYFLVTNPKNNNKLTVINRNNFNTNIGYRYMIGDCSIGDHNLPATSNDSGRAGITVGYDRF